MIDAISRGFRHGQHQAPPRSRRLRQEIKPQLT